MLTSLCRSVYQHTEGRKRLKLPATWTCIIDHRKLRCWPKSLALLIITWTCIVDHLDLYYWLYGLVLLTMCACYYWPYEFILLTMCQLLTTWTCIIDHFKVFISLIIGFCIIAHKNRYLYSNELVLLTTWSCVIDHLVFYYWPLGLVLLTPRIQWKTYVTPGVIN